MMEAARTSETSVDIQFRTWQYIPEDSELHTRRRENVKSHKEYKVSKPTIPMLLARHGWSTRHLVGNFFRV
jgi:hypothetical protein